MYQPLLIRYCWRGNSIPVVVRAHFTVITTCLGTGQIGIIDDIRRFHPLILSHAFLKYENFPVQWCNSPRRYWSLVITGRRFRPWRRERATWYFLARFGSGSNWVCRRRIVSAQRSVIRGSHVLRLTSRPIRELGCARILVAIKVSRFCLFIGLYLYRRTALNASKNYYHENNYHLQRILSSSCVERGYIGFLSTDLLVDHLTP